MLPPFLKGFLKRVRTEFLCALNWVGTELQRFREHERLRMGEHEVLNKVEHRVLRFCELLRFFYNRGFYCVSIFRTE